MKRPVNKFPILLLAIAAAVAVLMSVMTYVSATSAVLPDLAGIIASPFRAASASITRTVQGWVDYLTEFDALKAENEALKRQIADMESTVRQAELVRDDKKREK